MDKFACYKLLSMIKRDYSVDVSSYVLSVSSNDSVTDEVINFIESYYDTSLSMYRNDIEFYKILLSKKPLIRDLMSNCSDSIDSNNYAKIASSVITHYFISKLSSPNYIMIDVSNRCNHLAKAITKYLDDPRDDALLKYEVSLLRSILTSIKSNISKQSNNECNTDNSSMNDIDSNKESESSSIPHTSWY